MWFRSLVIIAGDYFISASDEFAQGEKCTRLTPILAQFSALVASHRGKSNIYLHNPDRINVVILQRRK